MLFESLAHAFEFTVNGVYIGELWIAAKQEAKEIENNG